MWLNSTTAVHGFTLKKDNENKNSNFSEGGLIDKLQNWAGAPSAYLTGPRCQACYIGSKLSEHISKTQDQLPTVLNSLRSHPTKQHWDSKVVVSCGCDVWRCNWRILWWGWKSTKCCGLLACVTRAIYSELTEQHEDWLLARRLRVIPIYWPCRLASLCGCPWYPMQVLIHDCVHCNYMEITLLTPTIASYISHVQASAPRSKDAAIALLGLGWECLSYGEHRN